MSGPSPRTPPSRGQPGEGAEAEEGAANFQKWGCGGVLGTQSSVVQHGLARQHHSGRLSVASTPCPVRRAGCMSSSCSITMPAVAYACSSSQCSRSCASAGCTVSGGGGPGVERGFMPRKECWVSWPSTQRKEVQEPLSQPLVGPCGSTGAGWDTAPVSPGSEQRAGMIPHSRAAAAAASRKGSVLSGCPTPSYRVSFSQWLSSFYWPDSAQG